MFTFPIHLFNPANIKVTPTGRTISGGEALSGEQDVIRTDGGGFWVVTFGEIDLSDPDLMRAWEAWETHLAGGVERVLIPVPSLLTAPRPTAGGILALPGDLRSQSDDPYFPEALGFATPLMLANIPVAGALRATTLVIDMIRGARLKGGERFSIDHATKGRRMYRVERVTARDGQEATCKIWPPLREAIGTDTAADFDWPSFVGAMIPDTDISPDIGLSEDAVVSIAFREVFA